MTPEQREEFDERAAIIEYDGKLTRAEAERIARRLVMPPAPPQEDREP